MATPHVAGVAALALSVNPTLSALQLKSTLLNNVDAVAGLAGKVLTGGRLNAAKVLNSLGLTVIATSPSAGATVTTPPTSFTIHFSQAFIPASVAASDFTVNGVAATSFVLDDADSITFQFDVSPVTTDGLQTMALAAGSITRQSDATALSAFSGQFRYDSVPLTFVSSTPPLGSLVSLPFSTLDLLFNEAVDASSIGLGDLSVSQGTVIGASLLNPTTVRFTLSGIANEGAFNFSIAAGALRDAYGNAGSAVSGAFSLDIGTVATSKPVQTVKRFYGLSQP